MGSGKVLVIFRHGYCYTRGMIDWTRQFGHTAFTWLMAGISVLWGATLWLWSLAIGPKKSQAVVRAETRRRHKKIRRQLRGLE